MNLKNRSFNFILKTSPGWRSCYSFNRCGHYMLTSQQAVVTRSEGQTAQLIRRVAKWVRSVYSLQRHRQEHRLCRCCTFCTNFHQPDMQPATLPPAGSPQIRKCCDFNTCPVAFSVYSFKMCPSIPAFPIPARLERRSVRRRMDVLLFRVHQSIERFRFAGHPWSLLPAEGLLTG